MNEDEGTGRVGPHALALYERVRALPVGRATTYGALARETGLTPRQVGMLMRNAPADLPWQRVVAAGGRIATLRRDPALGQAQIGLLKSEGVAFDALGRVEPTFLIEPTES